MLAVLAIFFRWRSRLVSHRNIPLHFDGIRSKLGLSIDSARHTSTDTSSEASADEALQAGYNRHPRHSILYCPSDSALRTLTELSGDFGDQFSNTTKRSRGNGSFFVVTQ